MKQEEILKQRIDNANKILITSHISPDPDAVCSALLLGEALKLNCPGKEIGVVLEEEPLTDLHFLEGYENIGFKPVISILESLQPDLFIIVDANSIGRVSRNDATKIRSYININKQFISTAVLDHHEPEGRDNTDIYINSGYPAATQEVYSFLYEKNDYQKPEGYAEIALLGILSDTYRFKYANPRHRETFKIVSDLIDAGASIEAIENRLERYTEDQIKVFGHLANNLNLGDGYSYSFIGDEFAKDWLSNGKSVNDFKNGCEIFINNYIRNIGDNHWGFVIYQDFTSGDKHYSVSFRSEGEVMDVAAVAVRVGGGGHKPSAGAKFEATNIKEAVAKVKGAIDASF